MFQVFKITEIKLTLCFCHVIRYYGWYAWHDWEVAP